MKTLSEFLKENTGKIDVEHKREYEQANSEENPMHGDHEIEHNVPDTHLVRGEGDRGGIDYHWKSGKGSKATHGGVTCDEGDKKSYIVKSIAHQNPHLSKEHHKAIAHAIHNYHKSLNDDDGAGRNPSSPGAASNHGWHAGFHGHPHDDTVYRTAKERDDYTKGHAEGTIAKKSAHEKWHRETYPNMYKK